MDSENSLSDPPSVNHRRVKLEKSFLNFFPPDISKDSNAIPDGGLRAWSVVFGVWLNQFSSFGYTNSFGVYNDYYVRNSSYTSSQIGWIGGTQLFIILMSGIVTGRLYDRGYFYWLVISGAVLNSLCLFMLSLVQPGQYYQMFLAQALGQGVGIGLSYVPALALISQYFDKKRAFAFGIASTGSAIGGVVHPILINNWFYGSLGYEKGVRMSAAFVTLVSLASLLFMRTRGVPNREKEGNFIHDAKSYLKEPPYLLTTVALFVVLLAMYEPSFFIQLSTIKNGIDTTLAFYTIAMMNGASFFGRIISSLLIPFFGVFNLQTIFTLICSILIFASIAVHDVAGTVTYTVLFGLFQGCYVGILAPLISSLAREDAEIGSRLGVCFSLTGIAGLFGSPIAGALLSSEYHWERPTLFAGSCFFLGAFCFCISRFILSHRKGFGLGLNCKV